MPSLTNEQYLSVVSVNPALYGNGVEEEYKILLDAHLRMFNEVVPCPGFHFHHDTDLLTCPHGMEVRGHAFYIGILRANRN